MKRICFLLITLLFFCCQENNNQEDDRLALLAMLNDIETLSKSVVCDDASDWNFVAYGHKACGGPHGFIAYSDQIDVNAFLVLVQNYTEAERSYNIKWGVVSDCSLIAEPTGVLCENGEAVLEY